MSYKSDVKAVQITGASDVFLGRTRLRGIILSATNTSFLGSIVLQDGNSVTQFTADVPPGDVFAFNFPEDGILFEGGIICSAITNAKATVLIDK